MKSCAVLLLVAALAPRAHADSEAPIAKVIQLIADNEAKVIGEGEEAQKVYTEFAEWCEENSKEFQFEIKNGKAKVEELKAIIEEETSAIEEYTAKIEELGASIASDEGDLKDATAIREKEAADFAAEEKELVSSIDMIERAMEILEKELGGASLLQAKELSDASSITDALAAMVKAAAFTAADADRLTALVQSNSEDAESEGEAGAPAAAAIKGKSGKIIETLQGLLEKGEGELDELRKEEQKKVNEYELMKQTLETDIKNANTDMEEAKKAMAESGEKKSVATGELEVTSKDLAEDIKGLEEIHHECMTKASDFEAGVTEREEELKALATAKKIIVEATGGKGSALQTDQAPSFLQV